ncbi:myb-like protein X [Papilio machaon]|uniref:myb-like protein X n=1 Tax=Papilio machaon TaxID=76193 RepID=UPI001E66552B|nr:myb-like protein X [Papilio machaon]
MLSSNDIERLIAEKRHDIEREKIDLGLSRSLDNNVEESKENNSSKKVQISKKVSENNYVKPDDRLLKEGNSLEEEIPADLERYIRRCTGLPIMLKAGEYSPNNPLVRGERAGTGDVMLGLGEYERRRNTLRRIRQQQYREYLDQQAKLKQEAKEKAERERREREEKERAREEERERERREIEFPSPVRRRASLNYGHDVSSGSNNTYVTKVDTAVQVESVTRPLSVAVQTEDVGLYPVPLVHKKLTQAERELSPRVAGEETHKWTEDWTQWKERRRSYGDFNDHITSGVRRSNKEKLLGDLRHTYMPSIFDADAIQLRNLQAEKEAAARRQFYQQELKNQILEQQRIREERKNREKMLEEAEMRRLEEQLRALKSAQTHETYRQIDQNEYMKEHSSEYEKKRAKLQNEIEEEKRTLLRSMSHKPVTNVSRDMTQTSHSEKTSKLPFYYQNKTNNKPPYSINIPENSIFSQNYDIDSYLRKNLNPSRESLMSNNLRELRVDNTDKIKHVKDNKNTKDNYTEHKYTRDSYTENKTTQENYTENKNTRQNYTENKNTRENYTESKNTRQNYTENKNTRENYTESKNTRQNYTENKNTRENYTENKNTRQNYIENGATRENYTENKSRENYTDNKNTRENYTDNKNTRENYTDNKNNNIIIEKALIHTQPKRTKEDTLPIPVLKHNPIKITNDINKNTELSKEMQIVDDKWKIPVVQKNILKILPKDDGKNINILTQLGSIRRQLQLEQLKLDNMIAKDDEV